MGLVAQNGTRRPNRQTHSEDNAHSIGARFLHGAFPLFGIEMPADESTMSLYVLYIGAALCTTAVIVLAVPMLFEQMRRWRANRRNHSEMRIRRESPMSPATIARTEQLIHSDSAPRTALGWSPDDVLDAPVDADAASGQSSESVAGQGKTILVADDDPVVVMALSRRLQHCGYQVLRSPDAAHALMGTIKVRPDLVILDVNMPAGNGLAVCEMMASDPHYAGIPVIIHSVVTDAATRERCQRLGAHYVEKSARSWSKVKSLIELLLQHHEAGATKPRDAAASSELQAASPAELSEETSPEEFAPGDGAAPVAEGDAEKAAESRVEDAEQREPEGESESSDATRQPATRQKEARGARPARQPASQPSRVPQHAASPVCGSSRVLCIEYPKDRLDLVEHQLSALGMSVTRMDDLEQGYWACFTENPHILVIQAAGCTKALTALLHNLGTHPVTRALPVLLIDEDQTATQDFATDNLNLTVLKYPVDWEELLGEMERYLPSFAGAEDHEQTERVASWHESVPEITPASDAVDAASFRAKNGKPTTVLCIDDDPVVIRSIAIRLQPYGIKVEGADNGTQGYLQAVATRPDVILLDLKMPNGAGNYVLLKLKENQYTREIPVIVLTIEANPGVRRNMMAVGAAGFLGKPVRWPELFEAMGHSIALPRQLLEDYKLTDSLTVSKR